MKYFIFSILLAVFFTACDKDIDTRRTTTQVSVREPGISGRLMGEAIKYAKMKNYMFSTDKDTLHFTKTQVGSLPNDTARYNEVSDSLAGEIYNVVYLKRIEKLPEVSDRSSDYYTTLFIDYANHKTNNDYLYSGYIIFTSDFNKYYYDAANDIYYSTSNQHWAAPNGRNPFTFTTIFTDTTAGVVRELGRLRRAYNPNDRTQFPY